MNTKGVLDVQIPYGVHDWVNQHGNHGTEILSQHQTKVQTSGVKGLFDPIHEKSGSCLTDYFNPQGNSKLFVVVDNYLSESRRSQIEAYFGWCKMEKLLQDYTIMALAVHPTEKVLRKVSTVIAAAKQCGLKRRDLFVAIGSTMVTDIVGFAAAIYRRSTPWILVPTDLVGIIRCPACDNKLSVNHTSRDGKSHKAAFALSHPPIASFYDPSSLNSLHKDNTRHALAEMIKISIFKDPKLFSFIEAHLEKMLAGTQGAATLITAVELAAKMSLQGVPYENYTHQSTIDFGEEAVEAIEKINGITYEDADSVAIGIALTSALSYLKGHLCRADLRRVLNLLENACLPICDQRLEVIGLWEHMTGRIREHGQTSACIIPIALGKGGYFKVTDLSPEIIGATLSVLRKHDFERSTGSSALQTVISTVDVTGIGDTFHESYLEQKASEKEQFHVVSVPEIFNKSNTILIQDYCVDQSSGRKRKVLVVVDQYVGDNVASVEEYFKSNRSAVGDFCILSMHVSSNRKDIDSVLTIADAAIDLRMSQHDVLVVVGGGTIMDIAGFAAAILKGGIPYVRIPTTLVGMIDAGVGVKVGVNFGDHKNLIGRYFPPVACLNDPESFLDSLPQREFACGLAEAIKMALVKSPRLFEVIEKYHRSLEYNKFTPELISLSIRTMLEELQPNLHEHDLRRLADFGHEFGHIVEGLAKHEIPHGECVAIGMALSCYLAYMKGYLSRSDLERILNCILDMRLPIHSTHYDCCNPDILWSKIRTEGIEHKNGMLWLAVPKMIGHGSFLDNISDIDAGMVSTAILSLRRYTDQHKANTTLKPIELTEAAASKDPTFETGKPSLTNGNTSHPNGGKALPYGDMPLLDDDKGLFNGNKPLSMTAAIIGASGDSHQLQPIVCLQHSESFKSIGSENMVPGTTLLQFYRSGDEFYIHAGASSIARSLERSLSQWFKKLLSYQQDLLTDYMSLIDGLYIRLRSDTAMTQIGGFSIKKDSQHDWQGFIDIHTGLTMEPYQLEHSGKIDDIIGHEGYHLLSFLLRGRKPLYSESERDQEQAEAENWKEFLRNWDKPYVIVVDVGATYLRVGIMGPHGHLLDEPVRVLSPSKQAYPKDTIVALQGRLMEMLVCKIEVIRASHRYLALEEVAVSFGAVITRKGVVEDASILWNDSAKGYNLEKALTKRLPGTHFTILNDISAAAWRYKDEGRFCLVTVSSGLSNKVFNPDLRALDRLDLDAAGVGGEMGHVVVEPHAVDALVQHAISQAMAHPEEFKCSQLYACAHGDAQKISARILSTAVKDGDGFTMRLLEETDVPYCFCGNLADLCSYSSGRGALRQARRLAARGRYNITPNEITNSWLQQAVESGHPLALKVLYDSTYPLALRILQLAADIGLDKFIIVGGFAMKTGKKAYLQALQNHLTRFCHNSAFFRDWSEDKVRGLVKFGVDDDNNGLIGIGHFVQHLHTQYHAVEKAIGEQSLTVTTRSIPRCGAQEVLAKVVFSGICTTDLQILRSERGYEPTVLGHEGVCQVLEVGKDVTGLDVGEMIVLNPNNPLDDYDKLGHTREGMFQEYVKFGQEFLAREQVLKLGRSVASATDTLIEPLSGVVAAQERIKDRITGRNVLIIGAGLMGLMFVTMNINMGARNVYLANRSKERLDCAVAKGIIAEEKVFVTGDSVARQLDAVSGGEGADIVIICVSIGHGVCAAQDAATYVNTSGCIYLFAGFRPGDTLALDDGSKIDAWSVRSRWKTERVQIAGKLVDLSGHRGSRVQDLAMAANVIHRDTLSFGRMISHVVSLKALPDIMLGLARDGKIQGVPAQRVVVDMTARGRLVESAGELPLRHLHEAMRKPKDAISMANLFREIGFEGQSSLLGWACPPAWQDITVTIETALQMASLSTKKHFIWVGTGGWLFLVDALKEAMLASKDIMFRTISSLDPQALTDLFTVVGDLSTAVCLGISQLGKTMETIMLMDVLRERFDSAGLNYRNHFIWLTDTRKSHDDCKSGEAVIRSSKVHDWKHVDMVPLTVGNHADINALFAAPHSVLMFLPLILLLRKDLKAMQHIYQQYLALRDEVMTCIIPKAYTVAFKHIDHIKVSLDESIAPAMVRLITQLIEQGLGSKQAGFNPRVCVASGGEETGFELITLPILDEIPAAVKIMLIMNTLSAFVATVAYHRKITFVTHPKVDLYKRRTAELMAAAEIEQPVSDPGKISTDVTTYLGNNPRTRFVEVLCYGHVPASYRQSVKEWLASCLTPRTLSISVDVVAGEEWNHSRYQAAVQREDTLYVILVLQEYCFWVEGISKEAVCRNARVLREIARATYETLQPKALYFRVGNRFVEDGVSLKDE